ncbi:MAG TPA: hypothetical protein VLN46_05500 [Gillisia sp.]|nr:hypothetical protein [Gillisia sp.]
MKKYFKIIFSLLIVSSFMACDKDDDELLDLNSLDAPQNLGATFQITQDNSGLVTIIPTGEGAVLFDIDFGDGSAIAEDIKVGGKVEHYFEEGQYDVEITGKTLNGKTATGIQPLTVSFLAPENLQVNITRDPNDNYTISVSATADNAAMYQVYFGEEDDEEPTPLMPGESVSYTYSSVGTYNVRVVALSGGVATTEEVTSVTITDPLYLPINFESATLNYTFSNFGGGEGAGVPIIDNPDPSGVNTSDKVASYTKVAGSEVWAGTTIALDEPIDFSTNQFIAVDVWSPVAGAQVLFKIENLADPNVNVEFSATTSVSNQWETLIFDLTAINPAVEYGRIALFFNFGVPGTGETYYFDNIRTIRLELVKLPLTFESETLSFNWGGFGGADGAVITNPDKSGINTSEKVTALTKGNGSEVWAGISLNLDEAVDFSAGTTIKMKVWSPKAGAPVLFKFEDSNSPPVNGNPSVVVEVFQNTTTSNEWEEMSFDLTSFPAFDTGESYDRVVIFYDFGAPGTGSTFYFDDIRLTSEAEPTAVVLPLRFETEGLTYTWSGFGGAEGEVVTNPDKSGINTSDNVTSLLKSNGAEGWAGISMNLEEPLDFIEGTKVKMKVWSPKEGAPILLKFEDSDSPPDINGNPSVVVEVIVNTTTSNQWEELTFDLTTFGAFSTSISYDRVIVFYDFGNPGTGATFYFDDIRLTN